MQTAFRTSAKNADEMTGEFRTIASEFGRKFYSVMTKSSLTTLEDFTKWFKAQGTTRKEDWMLGCKNIVIKQGKDFPSNQAKQIGVLYETARAANSVFHAAELRPPPLTVYRGMNVPKEEVGKLLESLQSGVFVASAAHSTSLDASIAKQYATDGQGVQVLMRINGVTNGWDQNGNLTAQYEDEEEITVPPNVYEVRKIHHDTNGKTLIVDLEF